MAATGTIAGDGTVGPVGGTGQKAAAVRAKGAELFLVPSADYEDAVNTRATVEVVAVDTSTRRSPPWPTWAGNADDLPPAGRGAG